MQARKHHLSKAEQIAATRPWKRPGHPRLTVDLRKMVEDNMAGVNAESVWRLLGRLRMEGRQDWLEIAGWDSGGWVFKNWHDLPHKMHIDLDRTCMRFIKQDMQRSVEHREQMNEEIRQISTPLSQGVKDGS